MQTLRQTLKNQNYSTSKLKLLFWLRSYYRRSDGRLKNKTNFAETSYPELLVYPRELLSRNLRLRRTKKGWQMKIRYNF